MKKTIFIGQAMPRYKRHLHDWPSLNKWLYRIDITDNQIKKYFYYSALIDYFPGSVNGSHLIPTKEEIFRERKNLRLRIKRFDPEIIVPVGKMSISNALNQKVDLLEKVVGNKFIADPYLLLGKKLLIIPFPHPSGASTWLNDLNHKKFLNKALFLLKENLDGD